MRKRFRHGETLIDQAEFLSPNARNQLESRILSALGRRPHPPKALVVVSAGFGNPFAVSSKWVAMRRQDQADVQFMQPVE